MAPRCRRKTGWRSRSAKSEIMAYKSDSAFLDSARSLLIAACTSFVMVSPVRAAEPTAAAPQLADGTWLVQARVDSDRRYCSDRLVRLTNRQGELSGAVALARPARLYITSRSCRMEASRELHGAVWQG